MSLKTCIVAFCAAILLAAVNATAAPAQPLTPAQAQFRARHRASVAKTCRHRASIIAAASEQKVSPHLMVGCLISEHTYLKDGMDDIVDYAALAGFYGDPSIGLAQIKLSTAREIARQLHGPEIAEMGFQAENQFIIAELMTPAQATRYMARLIRNIIADYKSQGFDISGSVGLVCSSYLIGGAKARARAHRLNGTLPGLNYYGRFAIKNEAIARNVISGAACNR